MSALANFTERILCNDASIQTINKETCAYGPSEISFSISFRSFYGIWFSVTLNIFPRAKTFEIDLKSSLEISWKIARRCLLMHCLLACLLSQKLQTEHFETLLLSSLRAVDNKKFFSVKKCKDLFHLLDYMQMFLELLTSSRIQIS